MSAYLHNMAEKFSRNWLRITNLNHKKNLSEVDFTQSWWSPLIRRKFFFVIILSGRIISTVLVTLLPILIGKAIVSQKISYFGFLFLIWFLAEVWRYITLVFSSRFVAGIISGVRYSAYKFFLTVDPVYHTERSTGVLFGKVERCAHSYEEFIDSAVHDILPIVVGMITVIFSFFVLNTTIGLMAIIFLVCLSALNACMVLFNGLAFEKKVIKSDDGVRAHSMESLIQIQLVRSAFATNQVNKDMENKNRLFMAMDGTYFISYHSLMMISRILYAGSVCVLGAYIMLQVSQGLISVVAGTAFLITYIHGTYHIIKIGKRIQKFVRSITRIKDLFLFIENFGKQTFPVLKEDKHKPYEAPTSDVIVLQASGLNFAYKDTVIFKDHNLHITVPYAQENKLYGIIGPSGAGKTTFISILGGQLKSDKGDVLIDGISVYGINDNGRRRLIALQGQSASSLSGTLKDNLLLGIPKGISLFKDQYMIDILKRVGIWHMFKEKEGLKSMVGEGGFTLSVGQRQRLNFASLYLRTKYYKPLLVMIDEPTSSLDEVSEQAITDMIQEIAVNALVFVIAHRLHTIHEAVGILDFSLIETDKNLVFHSRDVLLDKSPYYQKLIRGEVAIEE